MDYNKDSKSLIDFSNLNPVNESEAADAFPEAITPENKNWCMLALGFKPVGKRQWRHKDLGFFEIIEFDINSDNLEDLPAIIQATGIKIGKHQIRESFKKLLGL